jgi:hypothetical protein
MTETACCPVDAADDEYDRQQLLSAYHDRGSRITALEGALRDLLNALAMGPLEIAAKYGPDAHPDEPVVDAAHKATAVLSDLQ